MGLIKSPQIPATLSRFSMADIESHARSILAQAQERSDELLRAAQEQADVIRQRAQEDGARQGHEAGYAKGIEEGRHSGHEAALSEHRRELGDLIKTLAAAVSELDSSRVQLQAEARNHVVQLAVAIARKVTRRLGIEDRSVTAVSVQEAMRIVAHAADVRIFVHPTQIAYLNSVLPALRQSWPKLHHVELVEDESIAPGGCRIRTAHGMVDADLDMQIDRIAAELLPSAGSQSP